MLKSTTFLVLFFFLTELTWRNTSWRSQDWSIKSTMNGERISEMQILIKSPHMNSRNTFGEQDWAALL